MHSNPTPTPPTPPVSPWYRRHSSSLVVLAMVLFIVFMQWPMLKGIAYRTLGTSVKSNIAWRTDLAGALAEARKANLPVLVDFTAEWCPPCQTMKADVWPDKQVEDLANTSYIPVLIDVDSNQATALEYRVRSIPTIAVLLPDGSEVARGGFMSRSAMRRFLTDNAVTLYDLTPTPEDIEEPEAIPASSDHLIAETIRVPALATASPNR